MKKTTYKDNSVYSHRGKYIVHFLAFIRPDHDLYGIDAVSIAYAAATEWASSRRGKRYHNKSFGGGIAFPSLQAAWDAIDQSPRDKQTANA